MSKEKILIELKKLKEILLLDGINAKGKAREELEKLIKKLEEKGIKNK